MPSGIGSSTQTVDPAAMAEKGRDPYANGFDSAAEVFQPRCVRAQTVRLREDQHAGRLDRDRGVDRVVFVLQRQRLSAELEANARKIGRRNFVFADDEGFHVTRNVQARSRRQEHEVGCDEEIGTRARMGRQQQLGLNDQGYFDTYSNGQAFNGTSQSLQLGLTVRLSKRIVLDFRETGLRCELTFPVPSPVGATE